VNQGVRVASGEFILLLNPDAFLEPSYVATLVQAFEEAGDPFGMATGKLLQAETGLIDSMGIRMTRSGRHFDIGQGVRSRESGVGCRGSERFNEHSDDIRAAQKQRTMPSEPALGLGGAAQSRLPPALDEQSESSTARSDSRLPTPDPREEIFGVSGAAAMYRMSFISDVTIGGEFLDEDFFTFREDADVAWRGQLFGWRAMYVPEAVGHHVRTVTPEKRRALTAVTNMHGVKNRFLLRFKNEGIFLALRNAPFELGRDLVVIAAALTVERTSLPALSWLWKNRRRIMEKRRAIQNRRRVSDRRIARWFR
jgi:GT2 family glycosyltransferase